VTIAPATGIQTVSSLEEGLTGLAICPLIVPVIVVGITPQLERLKIRKIGKSIKIIIL